ncbi:MAG: hypothetical protein HYZ28_19465 [Myxococcales bacterium]|nr:hypothetical protein [Myxococcales bacterium]
MLVIAALLAATAGPPTFSAAVTRREGVEAQAALELAESLSLSLERAGGEALGKRISPRALQVALSAANVTDAATCSGDADCAVRLGQIGGVRRLLALQLVKLGRNLIIDVSVIDVESGAKVAAASARASIKAPEEALAELAAQLARSLPPYEVPKPKEPERAMAPPAIAASASAPPGAPRAIRPSTRTLVVGGIGGGLVTAGTVMGGLALLSFGAERSAAESWNLPAYERARAEAKGRALAADLLLGAGALALGAAAVLHFTGPGGVSVGAAPSPGGGGAFVSGSF